ncbi:hypothetical protein THIOSC15_2100001 [uncultured Thiomicrorhabdus sp.]
MQDYLNYRTACEKQDIPALTYNEWVQNNKPTIHIYLKEASSRPPLEWVPPTWRSQTY